jgi:hypothetical protein
MLRLVAPITDQLSVLARPDPTSAGVAVKLMMEGASTTLTVVVAVVTDPAAFVAVRV